METNSDNSSKIKRIQARFGPTEHGNSASLERSTKAISTQPVRKIILQIRPFGVYSSSLTSCVVNFDALMHLQTAGQHTGRRFPPRPVLV